MAGSAALALSRLANSTSIQKGNECLGAVFDIFKIALLPLGSLGRVAGERMANFVENKLAPKVEEILPEKRQEIPGQLIYRVGHALTYTDDDTLQEMFAKLLASAANKDCDRTVHPSFVDKIGLMSSEDAIFLKELSGLLIGGIDVPCISIRYFHGSRYVIAANGLVNMEKYDIKDLRFFLDNMINLGFFSETYEREILSVNNEYAEIFEKFKNKTTKYRYIPSVDKILNEEILVKMPQFRTEAVPVAEKIVHGLFVLTNLGSRFLKSVT